jgi:hypothetical protein
MLKVLLNNNGVYYVALTNDIMSRTVRSYKAYDSSTCVDIAAPTGFYGATVTSVDFSSDPALMTSLTGTTGISINAE